IADAYNPAPTPARLTPLIVAVPLASVTASPTSLPLNVKWMLSPATALPPPDSVAERSAVPPKVPFAAATETVVASRSTKQTLTDESDGVVDELPVVRNAL